MIGRAKFAAHIHGAGLVAGDLVQDYARHAAIAEPASLTETVSRDPDDDLVLATALGAEASLIVSGDRDLLMLGAYRNIRILAADDALRLIGR